MSLREAEGPGPRAELGAANVDRRLERSDDGWAPSEATDVICLVTKSIGISES